MPSESVKVAVRVRPFNQREKNANSKCIIHMNGNSTTINHPESGEKKTFTFDHSYWSHDGYIEKADSVLLPENSSSKYSDQQKVFDELGKQVLDNAWEGYNSTLFAYGQTGSGKSYSMIGYGPNKGIVPITCGELFKAIESVDKSNGKEMQVTFSMLEIYNEQVRDLLVHKTSQKGSHGGLKVRQDNNQRFYVPDLRQLPCRDYVTIEKLMEEGTINRTTASTNMNATSSRSHMVITIKFKQVFNNDLGESTTKTSEINLVDLAGSERAKATGATGDRLKEGSAINVSLLTLGSVIEALAENNPKAVIPYRESVLTKLLKSALGGNSKTVMIAALSPADINYEETLSTLRYADRAKKIQNKAVINLSPTEKLIHDLKAENARLLQLLSSQGENVSSDATRADIQHLLAQNEQQMQGMKVSWSQKLEDARKQWEAEHEAATDGKLNKFPYFQNVNEDPQLCGVIKRPIEEGITRVGKCTNTDGCKMYIALRGLGIQEHHANLISSKSKVYAELVDSNEVSVNGVKVTTKTALKHGDRIKMGSNSLFLYIGFPHERKIGEEDITKKYDYDFFQNELATSLGINYDLTAKQKDSGAELVIAAVYNDYLTLMPMVAEVNAISEELKKDVKFSLMVCNLASYDSAGQEKEKKVAVNVVHQVTNQVWVWSKAKFINRKYLIEELYQKFVDNPDSVNISKDVDPFWDPVEDVYLGCAHAWLHSLAYRMSYDEQVAVLNHSGAEEGEIQVSISSCTPSGEVLGDEAMIIDPHELLGKRFDIMVNLHQCIALKWIKQNSTRGIVIKFRFYNERFGHQSRTSWNTVNPRINLKQHLVVENVDNSFLNYLHSSAIIFEIWGLQAGRKEQTDVIQDTGIIKSPSFAPSPPSTSNSSLSSDFDNLEKEYEKSQDDVKKLVEEKEELLQLCRILKKENGNLKNKIKDVRKKKVNGIILSPKSSNGEVSNGHKAKDHQEKEPSESYHLTNGDLQPTKKITMDPLSNNIQADLGRALKVYFTAVKPVQAKLSNLQEFNLPLESKQAKNGKAISSTTYFQLRKLAEEKQNEIKELNNDFSKSLTNLKESVAAVVRARKTERMTNGTS